MKKLFLFLMFFTPCFFYASAMEGMKSIRDFGVSSKNSPQENAKRLQSAIDEMSGKGGAIFVEPDSDGYPMSGGILLRKNVSLIGVNGPVGRGTNGGRGNPVGSVFKIYDMERPFISVQSATQIRGIQFFYPNQDIKNPKNIIEYPPTIVRDKSESVMGVTLSCLTFFGEFCAMDFTSGNSKTICEQILFEHCYGYPLGGEFIKIDKCYDIPRILHCHVNPANQRLFKGETSRNVIDSVVRRKTFSYSIESTDNAQLIDIFTFGVFGGIKLGANTYGQLTNFNLDCVSIGILKEGAQNFNRNWQIAQGSIIANAGERLEDVHPIKISGFGHTSIANVEAFSGNNGALTNFAASYDFLYVDSEGAPSISLSACRMRGYKSKNPITNKNPKAKIRAWACINKNLDFFEIK